MTSFFGFDNLYVLLMPLSKRMFFSLQEECLLEHLNDKAPSVNCFKSCLLTRWGSGSQAGLLDYCRGATNISDKSLNQNSHPKKMLLKEHSNWVVLIKLEQWQHDKWTSGKTINNERTLFANEADKFISFKRKALRCHHRETITCLQQMQKQFYLLCL